MAVPAPVAVAEAFPVAAPAAGEVLPEAEVPPVQAAVLGRPAITPLPRIPLQQRKSCIASICKMSYVENKELRNALGNVLSRNKNAWIGRERNKKRLLEKQEKHKSGETVKMLSF